MRSWIALLLMLTACASFGRTTPPTKSADVADCPDNPSCLTTPACNMDNARGCNACRCSPAGVVPNPGIVNSESIPPPQ